MTAIIIEGQVRARKGFLWLPKTIKGDTRWLSNEEWMEVYEKDPHCPFLYFWNNYFWIT